MARSLSKLNYFCLEPVGSDETGRLFSSTYELLCSMAARRVAHHHLGPVMEAKALVHEAFLRFAHKKDLQWKNRSHFFATAAEAMRQILIEHARRQNSLRRAGNLQPMQLDEFQIAGKTDSDLLMRMNEALERLAAVDPLKAELVKLRFFTGLKLVEIGGVLGLAERTVKWHWALARAWLRVEFSRLH